MLNSMKLVLKTDSLILSRGKRVLDYFIDIGIDFMFSFQASVATFISPISKMAEQSAQALQVPFAEFMAVVVANAATSKPTSFLEYING